MSLFTSSISGKRPRRSGTFVVPEVLEELSMQYGAGPSIVVGPKREVGGGGVQKASSRAKKNRTVFSSFKFMNQLFPRSSIRVFNYGENMYGSTGSLGRTDSSGTGNVKAITSQPTRQDWIEFWGLPLYNFEVIPGATNHLSNMKVPVYSVNNVVDLMELASKTSALDSSVPLNKYFYQLNGKFYDSNSASLQTVPTDTFTIRDQYKATFAYEGGYQKHTFKNQSEAQCFIEIYECVPREAMFDWKGNTTGNHLTWNSVGDLVIEDLKRASLGNYGTDNVTTLQATPTRFDEVKDIRCSINSKCFATHRAYKVSKPVRVSLAPGETFVYTMNFPSFSFDDFHWVKPISAVFSQNLADAGYDQIDVMPTSIPKFTKKLVCRFWGEQGAQKSTSVVNSVTVPTPGTVAVEGAVPVYLIHTQEEKHNVRFIPAAVDMRSIVRDLRDQDTAATSMLVIDDENDDLIDPEL